MPAEEGQRIAVKCKCGTKLKVPASAAGKKAKCPKCESVFKIPHPKPKPVPAAAAPPAEEGSMNSLLEELAQQETTAESIGLQAPPAEQKKCGRCGTPMRAGAVVCESCGAGAGMPKPKKERRALKAGSGLLAIGAGTLVLGIILSCVGAAIGAGVWFAVAMTTGYEVGYVAIGVGMLAGGGMYLGYRQQNGLAGVIAAVTSVGGILLGKLLIFVYVIGAIVSGDSDNIEVQREGLRTYFAMEQLDPWADDPDAEYENAYDQASRRVENMSDEQVRLKWQEYKDMDPMFMSLHENTPGQKKLVAHRTDLRALHDRLPSEHVDRYIIRDEEYEAVLALPEEELNVQLDDLDAWEDGAKWNDSEYVYDLLIFLHTDEALLAEVDISHIEDYYEPSIDRWQSLTTEAIAKVDAIPEAERPSRARQMNAHRKRELENLEDAITNAVLGEAVGSGAFFQTFEGLDFVFLAFALFSAFGLASGRTGGED